MNTIMATDPQQQSFSFSRRYFTWKKKSLDEDEDDMEAQILNTFRTNSSSKFESELINFPMPMPIPATLPKNSTRKKFSSSLMSVLKLRPRTKSSTNLGSKIVGTLFGNRRGHVHFAFQDEFNREPAFLVELATPTSVLVKEMASGLVRVALECDKKAEKKGTKLIEEKMWRSYCNGKKCGYAIRRECGENEWKVLNAIGPISMGAGVLPGAAGKEGEGKEEGEMMYMRAKFERVVGSKDSEAFYMMNPDGNGGPELSIYLLRV